MNIPLDRLYHFINNLANTIYGNYVIIYRFWPHGSKKINNLKPLSPVKFPELEITPQLYCNDQEPLDYDFYKQSATDLFELDMANSVWLQLLKSINCVATPQNLNSIHSIFEKSLLLHSEKRSHNLEKYQQNNEFITVYYWAHAVISRDWFRFAQHEFFNKSAKKLFLIYNRAWSGTREYRLKFIELLIKSNLQDYCQTNFNPSEPESKIHYHDHKFKNLSWRPDQTLENYFPLANLDSNSSADFATDDYNNTEIEVVLETLFDDDRLHLTEKSLRPIACGQPFILASTHGSLQYLRSYGFKTFGDIWDESYDQIEDSTQRLRAIADLMKNIASWDPVTKTHKIAHAVSVAEYNKKYFFSDKFFNTVIGELTTNIKLAFDQFNAGNNYTSWLHNWDKRLLHSQVIEFLNTNLDPRFPTKSTVDQIRSVAQHQLEKIVNKNNT
jgi:hypothetical protein